MRLKFGEVCAKNQSHRNVDVQHATLVRLFNFLFELIVSHSSLSSGKDCSSFSFDFFLAAGALQVKIHYSR